MGGRGLKPHHRRESKGTKAVEPRGAGSGAPRAVFRHLKGCHREEGPSSLCGFQGVKPGPVSASHKGEAPRRTMQFHQQRRRREVCSGSVRLRARGGVGQKGDPWGIQGSERRGG